MQSIAANNHTISGADVVARQSSLSPENSQAQPRDDMHCARAITNASTVVRHAPANLRQRLHMILNQCRAGKGSLAQSKKWRNEDFHACWAQWEKQGEPDEQRHLAVQRMHKCLELGSGFCLCLSWLGLRSLPQYLPPTRHLKLICNQLKHLPSDLPDEIKILNAAQNQLRDLPRNLPAGLEELDLGYNRLSRLPQSLPNTLRNLNVRHNQLTAFPESVPDALTVVDVSGNRLSTLPSMLQVQGNKPRVRNG